jgi:CRISPR-associated protein Cmr6
MSDLPPIQGAATLGAIFGDRALPGGANAGLVFDRYLRIWAGGVERPDKSTDVRTDLDGFVTDYNARVGKDDGHNALLAEHHRRLDAIAGPSGRRSFRTAFRLATGLGQEHPLENGFVFDRVLGVPMLPGSSVKGLLRAYLGLEEKDTLRDRLLGRQEQPGCLVVLPALPARWPRLAVDVVNCHHPDYYAGRRREPVDWENPNPVYFLTVDVGVDFIFRLALVAGREDSTAMGEAFDALEQALGTLGIGAKTAVGYGVLKPAE